MDFIELNGSINSTYVKTLVNPRHVIAINIKAPDQISKIWEVWARIQDNSVIDAFWFSMPAKDNGLEEVIAEINKRRALRKWLA